MVCIQTETLEKSVDYEKYVAHAKPASALTKEEAFDYLQNCDLPVYFASPWPKVEGDFRRGKTGDLIYWGDIRSSSEYKRMSATRQGEMVEMDTYFNSVIEKAVEENWIKLHTAPIESGKFKGLSPMLFSDVFSIRLKPAFERASILLQEAVREREEREKRPRQGPEIYFASPVVAC